MKIHWTANSIPEITDLPRQEQRQLLRQALSAGRKRRGMPLFMFSVAALTLGLLALYLYGLGDNAPF